MFKQAEEKDLIEVLYIYRICVIEMNQRGLFNWNTNYPAPGAVLEDIKKGELFVYKEDNVTYGAVCLNHEEPEEYSSINWEYGSPYLVVHRLAVHPSFRNRKIGQKIMEEVMSYASGNGYQSIRLDAISSNPSALRLYEKCGFTKKGPVHFSYQREQFICMEREVS